MWQCWCCTTIHWSTKCSAPSSPDGEQWSVTSEMAGVHHLYEAQWGHTGPPNATGQHPYDTTGAEQAMLGFHVWLCSRLLCSWDCWRKLVLYCILRWRARVFCLLPYTIGFDRCAKLLQWGNCTSSPWLGWDNDSAVCGWWCNVFADKLVDLWTFFLCCQEESLSLSPQKTELFMTEVIFMGECVGRDAIQADLTKMMAVVNWETSSIIQNLEAFLGLTGYFWPLI